jgi:hypothetical protein
LVDQAEILGLVVQEQTLPVALPKVEVAQAPVQTDPEEMVELEFLQT